MPAVSVILPVHNAASTIERAIRSILRQTLTDLELLVVDDGSTDDTPGVVCGIRDERLRLISTPHQGVAAAANTGTQAATADLIARMDADDFSQPQRLAAQKTLLLQDGLDAVGCRVQILDEQGRHVPSLARYERWINDETLSSESIAALRFVELPLVNPTILARRRYFELGFRDDDLPEDYDLLLRAAQAGMTFGKCPQVLFDWYDSAARLTRRDARYTAEAFMKCRRLRLREGPLSAIEQVDVWGAGRTGKPWIVWLQSCGIRVRRAIDVSSERIGKDIHGVPVIAPDSMPPADSIPLISAVGAAGARELIVPHLRKLGYTPGKNAWFVA